MFCPLCRPVIAVNNVDDPKWASEVAKRWNKDLDGALEKWKCPKCKIEFLTKMTKGVRVYQPTPVKVEDEVPA
jgi:hypothetical protein